ncbi:MAG: hypothetical protein IGS49_23550 [Chlorogloeopsis fritschii C42_A2020_084]|nr:hypothetical protein [Chlorogloeopsis fritschii C42_A2020_084]
MRLRVAISIVSCLYSSQQGEISMQRILITSGKALIQSVIILFLMLFFSILALLFSIQQQSFAVTSQVNQLTPEEKIERAYGYSEAAGIREEDRQQAYEQAVKDSKNPQKAYEKASREDNLQPNLIEKAGELVDKVTGK